MSGVNAGNLEKIASVRLSDGTLEVNLIEFARTETGDKWVERVVGYIPDGKRYPTQRMFLDPPRNWKPEGEELLPRKRIAAGTLFQASLKSFPHC